MEQNKITNEAVIRLVNSATILQMDASGVRIPDAIDIFGEVNSHEEQVRMAKIIISRISDAYCRD